MIVRRDQRSTSLRYHFLHDGLALLARGAAEVHNRALGLCTCDLGGRRDRWHDDVRGDVEGLGCERECLRMVSFRIISAYSSDQALYACSCEETYRCYA